MNYDKKVQLLIIGDSTVGKTSILSRYTNGDFNPHYLATVGLDFFKKDEVYNGKTIRIKIWDTAGQERYKAITRAYYKGAKGAFIVYDITRKETFDDIDKWRNELVSSCNKEVTVMLIGNKCDLEDQREITKEQGEEKAKSFGFSFIETSALSGENLEKGFEMLIKEIYQKYKVEQRGSDAMDIDGGEEIKIGKTNNKKKCC